MVFAACWLHQAVWVRIVRDKGGAIGGPPRKCYACDPARVWICVRQVCSTT